MSIEGVLREMRRRNMLRAVILYATSVWALAQGIASLGPFLNAPDWTVRWFLVAAIIGFPFWIAFAWFYELTPQGIRRESEAPPSESVTRATERRLDGWIIAVLAVAVVLLLTDRFVEHKRTTITTVSTDVAVPFKSVAVLPLVNESGDPDALYFSDGLSEGFITALSQFQGLKVIGRASSFQFRNSKEAVNVIGLRLGVAHLLEGSVQRAGDAVRISAELVNVRDGSTLWSQSYDRPYTDLFKLQDDVTSAVAGALKAKLMGASDIPVQSDRPPGGDLAAYNAFLEGQFYYRRNTELDLHRAIDGYTAATRLDPRYAWAWSALAVGWDDLASEFLGGVAQQQTYAEARKAADTALALAPDLAAAHSARGSVFLDADSDWTSAEFEYRRAVQLDPNYPAAKGNLANVLATLGQLQEATDLARQALASDPLRAGYYVNLALYLLPLGRLDEAGRAIHKAIELQPAGAANHLYLAEIEIQKGNAEAALASARDEPPGVWHDIATALALQIGSDRAAADAALKSLIGKYGNQASFQIAEVYALREDRDQTFAWLDRALALKDGGLQYLLYDAFILRYRDDPRFSALCRKLKLPAPH